MINNAQTPQLNILAVIRRFSNWFNRNFICSTIFSDGHIPEPYLTETECSIHTRRCKRCKATLGLGKWKHIPPPPNSTSEQIKEEYMKKEDFEQKGWKFSFEFDNEMKFEKGDVWKDDGQGAFLYIKTKKTEYTMDGKNYSFNTYIVKLTTTDNGFNQDGPNHSVKFNGECNTMDEFDMICKMIKLKI